MQNPKRPNDPNQKAKLIANSATGESKDDHNYSKNPVLVSKQYQVITSLLSEREESRILLEKKIQEIKSEIKVLKQASSLKEILAKPSLKPQRAESRGRKLDEKWKQVLQFIGGCNGVSVDTIMEYIKMNDFPISKPNLHVQLNSYSKKDWIRRTTEGIYVLTELGMKRIGFSTCAES